VEFLKVTMSDALVSSLSQGSAGGEDNRPMESPSLSFAKLEITFVPTDPSTGKPGPPVMGFCSFKKV